MGWKIETEYTKRDSSYFKQQAVLSEKCMITIVIINNNNKKMF